MILTPNTRHTILNTLTNALGGISQALSRARDRLSDAFCYAADRVAKSTDRTSDCVCYAADCFAEGVCESAEEAAI